VVNRLTCESQVIGGVVQGIGYGLMEDRIMDRVTGRMVNPDLEFYKIPSAEDMPTEIKAIMFEPFSGHSNTEVAGIGEPPKVPGATAIANAVYNAIGARVHSTPLTPQKVLAALAAKAKGSPPEKIAEATMPEHAVETLIALRDKGIIRNEREA
jgi:xanthine dehydrogenase YagR molybdenum-binding subunit